MSDAREPSAVVGSIGPRVVGGFEKYGPLFERFAEVTKRGLGPTETTRYIEVFTASGIAPRVIVEAAHRIADGWNSRDTAWPSPERVIAQANRLLGIGLTAPETALQTTRRANADRNTADAEFSARKRRVQDWRAESAANDARFRAEAAKTDRETDAWMRSKRDPFMGYTAYRAAYREGALVGAGLRVIAQAARDAERETVGRENTAEPAEGAP